MAVFLVLVFGDLLTRVFNPGTSFFFRADPAKCLAIFLVLMSGDLLARLFDPGTSFYIRADPVNVFLVLLSGDLLKRVLSLDFVVLVFTIVFLSSRSI